MYCFFLLLFLLFFILWSPFIPSRNLDELIHGFNESRSFNYTLLYKNLIIRSLVNIILRPILIVQTRLEHASYYPHIYILHNKYD